MKLVVNRLYSFCDCRAVLGVSIKIIAGALGVSFPLAASLQTTVSAYIFVKFCSFQHANVFQNEQIIYCLLMQFGLEFAMMQRG